MTYEEKSRQLIGNAVLHLMKGRKITQAELSANSGVSTHIIYKIIKGRNYEIRSLIKLFRVLQVHIELSPMSSDNNIHTMTITKTPLKNS